MAENFLQEVGDKIHVFKTSDDMCGQLSPLISPAMYREMIQPYQNEYFEHIRKYTSAKILLHCCGNIRPILQDVIDAGIDAFHPFQYSCPDMEPAGLKRDFGDRLVFWGGMDVQQVLPKVTAGDIRHEARQIIDIMAAGGGYVFSPTHNVQPDTPAENIMAMYETAAK
jgi:uroporphyrinogen decarboxylase